MQDRYLTNQILYLKIRKYTPNDTGIILLLRVNTHKKRTLAQCGRRSRPASVVREVERGSLGSTARASGLEMLGQTRQQNRPETLFSKSTRQTPYLLSSESQSSRSLVSTLTYYSVLLRRLE